MKKFLSTLTLAFSIIAIFISASTLNNIFVHVPFVHATEENVEDQTFSSPNQSRDIALHALSPGYTIDGVQNVGEYIEIASLADAPISLAGYSLRYTTKSGSSSTLFMFPEGSYMVGKTLLLRLASSPEASQADLTYTKTLALEAGPLELLYGEEVVDSVCWTGGSSCLPKFQNKDNLRTSIVQDLSTRTFAHDENYTPIYNIEKPGYLPPSATSDEDTSFIEPHCRGLELSEFLTYYDVDKSEQFIELHNSSEDEIDMTGCGIKYKTKILLLSGTIAADAYFAYHPDLALTKNPTSSNSYELIDTTGDVVDSFLLPRGQKKSTAYAQFGYNNGQENWLATYNPTPGEANNYQQFRSCPEGKVINEETGNCVKAATIAEVTECPAGKYRNPLTGRCKTIAEESTTAPCPEGYERNPETNRCRKIRDNDGTAYPLVPTTATEKTTFIAGLAIIAVLLVGATYIILQYRSEIIKFFKKKRSKNKPKTTNN